jgi:hypothetical protein
MEKWTINYVTPLIGFYHEWKPIRDTEIAKSEHYVRKVYLLESNIKLQLGSREIDQREKFTFSKP